MDKKNIKRTEESMNINIAKKLIKVNTRQNNVIKKDNISLFKNEKRFSNNNADKIKDIRIKEFQRNYLTNRNLKNNSFSIETRISKLNTHQLPNTNSVPKKEKKLNTSSSKIISKIKKKIISDASVDNSSNKINKTIESQIRSERKIKLNPNKINLNKDILLKELKPTKKSSNNPNSINVSKNLVLKQKLGKSIKRSPDLNGKIISFRKIINDCNNNKASNDKIKHRYFKHWKDLYIKRKILNKLIHKIKNLKKNSNSEKNLNINNDKKIIHKININNFINYNEYYKNTDTSPKPIKVASKKLPGHKENINYELQNNACKNFNSFLNFQTNKPRKLSTSYEFNNFISNKSYTINDDSYVFMTQNINNLNNSRVIQINQLKMVLGLIESHYKSHKNDLRYYFNKWKESSTSKEKINVYHKKKIGPFHNANNNSLSKLSKLSCEGYSYRKNFNYYMPDSYINQCNIFFTEDNFYLKKYSKIEERKIIFNKKLDTESTNVINKVTES